jgi:hypothetical protein
MVFDIFEDAVEELIISSMNSYEVSFCLEQDLKVQK